MVILINKNKHLKEQTQSLFIFTSLDVYRGEGQSGEGRARKEEYLQKGFEYKEQVLTSPATTNVFGFFSN